MRTSILVIFFIILFPNVSPAQPGDHHMHNNCGPSDAQCVYQALMQEIHQLKRRVHYLERRIGHTPQCHAYPESDYFKYFNEKITYGKTDEIVKRLVKIARDNSLTLFDLKKDIHIANHFNLNRADVLVLNKEASDQEILEALYKAGFGNLC